MENFWKRLSREKRRGEVIEFSRAIWLDEVEDAQTEHKWRKNFLILN